MDTIFGNGKYIWQDPAPSDISVSFLLDSMAAGLVNLKTDPSNLCSCDQSFLM